MIALASSGLGGMTRADGGGASAFASTSACASASAFNAAFLSAAAFNASADAFLSAYAFLSAADFASASASAGLAVCSAAAGEVEEHLVRRAAVAGKASCSPRRHVAAQKRHDRLFLCLSDIA